MKYTNQKITLLAYVPGKHLGTVPLQTSLSSNLHGLRWVRGCKSLLRIAGIQSKNTFSSMERHSLSRCFQITVASQFTFLFEMASMLHFGLSCHCCPKKPLSVQKGHFITACLQMTKVCFLTSIISPPIVLFLTRQTKYNDDVIVYSYS